MCAPLERGKATVIPARRPRPEKSKSPRTETWRGLPLHLEVGTQLTLVMRTEVTCRLPVEVFVAGAGCVARVVATGAPAPCAPDPPGEATPPALAAAATPVPSSAGSTPQSVAAAVAATAKLPRVRALVVANKVSGPSAPTREASERPIGAVRG